MNYGKKTSINNLIDYLIQDELPVHRLEIIGRNLWQRGLALQAQIHRVAAEMLTAEEARKLSLKGAARHKVNKTVVNRTSLKKYLAGRKERDEQERADQGTRLPL